MMFVHLLRSLYTNLARIAYRLSPGPIARRLAVRRPPFINSFPVSLPGGNKLLVHGLDQANVNRELFWQDFDGSNPEFTRVLYALSEDAQTIVDLGSYLGYYSLVAAKANPQARVFSVEPFPASIDYQRQAARINGLDNVTFCDVAVAESNASLPFFMPDRSQSKIPNIGSLKNRFGEGTHYADRGGYEIEVDALTLPDLVERYDIGKIDLIKFYVEEMEGAIFAAGRAVLEVARPDMLGWVFHREENLAHLAYLIDDLGYTCLVFKGQALVECPTIEAVRELSDVENLQRGGRSAVLFTTAPEQRMKTLTARIGNTIHG